MNKEELKDYLIEEAEMRAQRVNEMSPYELVDAYLKHNGIIGYTSDIIDVVLAATDTQISTEKLFE